MKTATYDITLGGIGIFTTNRSSELDRAFSDLNGAQQRRAVIVVNGTPWDALAMREYRRDIRQAKADA